MMPHGPLSDVWHEVSHNDDDGLGASHAPHCFLLFFVDAPGIVRAGLKLNGFQDTLRRPVALYPDRGKLYAYAD
jgi:hypothetical protein